MAPTKKNQPKSTVKKAAATRPRRGMPPRHNGPASSRKIESVESVESVGGAVDGGNQSNPSVAFRPFREKGLKLIHCEAVYNYLMEQKSKKTIKCADGRQIKTQGFEIGPIVFGLAQNQCVLYNQRIPLPTDHDEDSKWLKTISIERLNGLLASTGDFDVDSKYEEECIEHYVKTLIAAVNQKYVVGKDRLKNIEFFRAIVKEKLTHHEDGACIIAADLEEWAAAKQTIMMLAETTAASFKTLTEQTTMFAEETQKNFTLLSGAVATNKGDISNLKTEQGHLASRQDELEARLNAVFGTPAKAKAALVKKDWTSNSIDDMIDGQEDDFDGEDHKESRRTLFHGDEEEEEAKCPASPKATISSMSTTPSTPSWSFTSWFNGSGSASKKS